MDASFLLEATSKSLRPARLDLAVGLEAIYHNLPLGLVFPEVSKEEFLVRMVLAYSLQTSFDPTLDVGRVKSQTEVEDLPIVSVVVADGGPAREVSFPSPTG